MRKRIRRRKAKSKSISLSGPSTSREPLIGKPLLLDGEDAAAYERFSAQINATVQPIDTIERVFVDDIVSLEWEVLRWRRLKCGFIQTLGLKALKERLVRDLDYAQYSEYYVEDLAEILEETFQKATLSLLRLWPKSMPRISQMQSTELIRSSPGLERTQSKSPTKHRRGKRKNWSKNIGGANQPPSFWSMRFLLERARVWMRSSQKRWSSKWKWSSDLTD